MTFSGLQLGAFYLLKIHMQLGLNKKKGKLPGKGGVTLGSNSFRFEAIETGFMALGSVAAGLLSTCINK